MDMIKIKSCWKAGLKISANGQKMNENQWKIANKLTSNYMMEVWQLLWEKCLFLKLFTVKILAKREQFTNTTVVEKVKKYHNKNMFYLNKVLSTLHHAADIYKKTITEVPF